MRKRINAVIIFSLLFLVTTAAVASEYLYYKEVSAPENITHEVGAITFDSSMYFNTDNMFANLRIYDKNKNEVPYVIRKLRGKEKITTEYPVKMKILSLKELPDNRLSIILDRYDKDQQERKIIPSEVTIRTSNKNFEKTVSIYGSDDQEQWQLLGENQPIFDYSRFIDLKNTSVSFDKKSFKYYKVVIDNVAQALVSSFSQIFTKYAQGKVQEEYAAFLRYEGILHISDLDFICREEKTVYGEKKMIPYELTIKEITTNEKEKISDVYLSSQREPLTLILFSITSKNFKRKVVVEATNDSGSEVKWIRLASSELFDITAGDFHKQKLNIDLGFKGNRYRQYRVRIFNHDNAPIEVSSVRAEGSVHELVFFHNNEKELKIYYGGDDFKLPHYDVAAVLAEIPLIDVNRWNAGVQNVIANTQGAKKLVVSPKKMLVVALILMVIVLVYLIVVSVKKVDETTK